MASDGKHRGKNIQKKYRKKYAYIQLIADVLEYEPDADLMLTYILQMCWSMSPMLT